MNALFAFFLRSCRSRYLAAPILLGLPALSAASLLQPPISAWVPNAAPQPSVAKAPTPAPAPATMAVHPITVRPAAVAPIPAVTPPAPPPLPTARKNAVERLLAFQADGIAPGAFQPISGNEAIYSYRAWLRSFQTGGSQSGSASPGGSLTGFSAQQMTTPGSYGN